MNFISHIKTGPKLIISFMLLVVIVAAVALVSYQNLSTLDQGTKTMYRDNTIPIQQLGELSASLANTKGDVYEYIFISADRDNIGQTLQQDLDATDALVQEFEQNKLTADQAKIMLQFNMVYSNYRKAINDVLQAVQAGDEEKWTATISSGNFKTYYRAAESEITQLVTLNNQLAEAVNNQADSSFKSTRLILLIASLFGVIVAVTLGLVISQNITAPIKMLSQTIKKISVGDLDLAMEGKAYHNFIRRRDEMGDFFRDLEETSVYLTDMADVSKKIAAGDLTVKVTAKSEKDILGNAFAAMVENLNSVIREIMRNAFVLGKSSGELVEAASQAGLASSQISMTIQQVSQGINQESNSVNQTASSVDQMNKAINGVANGAHEQAGAVNEAAELTDQIFVAIKAISESADLQVKGSAELVANSERSAKTVEDTVKGMENIREKVSQSAMKVKDMGARSREIGTILATIDEIASQTNLLALNAAIEAARAGEHGKGFAVVADEVRKLAEKSASATREISGLIKQIQVAVSEAINSMDESASEVERGTTLAAQSRQALSVIIQAGLDGQKFGEEIARSAGQIQSLSDNLVGAMERVSAVVEQNSAATEQMAASSNDVTLAVEFDRQYQRRKQRSGRRDQRIHRRNGCPGRGSVRLGAGFLRYRPNPQPGGGPIPHQSGRRSSHVLRNCQTGASRLGHSPG